MKWAAPLAWLGLLSPWFAYGCTETTSKSQVMLVIDADRSVRARVFDIDLRVRSGEGPVESWTPRYDKSLTGGMTIAWPLEVSLVPSGQGPARNYEVVVTARGKSGGVLAQVRAVSGYVQGKSLRLPLRFDEACLARDMLCESSLTCMSGDCIEPFVDPTTLQPFSREPGASPSDGITEDAAVTDTDPLPSDVLDAGPGDGDSSEPTEPTDKPPPSACETDPTCMPMPACPDDRCADCPPGFVEDGDRCAPILLALTPSVGELMPALTAVETRFTVAVPLVSSAVELQPRVAEGVSIDVDGETLVDGDLLTVDGLQLGSRTLVLTLNHATHGKRTYTLTLERGGRQRVYLKAHNTGEGDNFGHAVAVSGDTIAVGAPEEDSSDTTGDDDRSEDSGGVYVFVREGASYRQQAFLKGQPVQAGTTLGVTVALDGDTLVVGSPGEDSNRGAAHVFVRSGGNWQHQAKLVRPRSTSVDAQLGRALFLRGDFLVVGAPGDDVDRLDAGAAFVFRRTGSTWSSGTRFAPSAPQLAGWFGSSVSCDDAFCAVGATGESGDGFTTGAVYVFARDGDSLTQHSRFELAMPGLGDFFGEATVLSGDLLAVGAFGATPRNATVSAGVIQLYTGADGAWTVGQQLIASNPSSSASFGARIALSGNLLVTNAPDEDSGASGINGDSGGKTLQNSGAVYLFERPATGGSFRQLALVKSDVPGAGDRYGFGVAFDGTTIVVGAPSEASSATGVDGDAENDGAPGSGAAYVIR